MADNYTVKDAGQANITIAADELSAGVFSPRVTPLHNGTDVSAANPLPVNATVSGNVTVQDGGNSLTVDGTVATTQSGTWNLGNITGSITLPTGAATEAKQDTLIGHVDGVEAHLANISANTPALVDGKVPVDVGSITISNLTLGNVTVDNTANNPVPVSDAGGSLTVDGSVGITGNVTVQDGGNSLTVDGAVSITGSLPTGSNTIGAVTISGTPAVSVSGTPTVSISGTPSVSISGALPTGSNTIGAVTISGTPSVSAGITGNVTIQDGGNSITVDGSVGITGALPAGTNNIGDVDVLSLPALPAGTNNIGDVDVLSIIPGTGATNLGKAEDAAHTSGDVGVMTLAVRKDVAGSFAATDGDYVPLQVDADGSLRVNVTAGGSSGGGGTQYDEDTAHEAGEKLTMAGVVRKDTAASLVGADNDRTSLIVDNAGKLWVNTGNVTIDSASPVTVAGNLAVVSGEFTRPADTTAYAIGDVVANSTSAAAPLQISGCARVNGGSGYIVGVELIADQKSITPAFRVHVFNAAPTQSNDNAAHRLLYADASKRVAEIVLSAMSTPSDTTNSTCSRIFDGNARIPFVCAAGTTTLWFVFETLTAFTPANGGKFTLRLLIDRN